ncbi:unnamed protein product, partial [marine sediment metagenome]
FLKEIIGWEKQVDAFCDPNINRLHKAHKEALAQKATFKEPLKKAEGMVKEEIKQYLVEQDRIRREAEEKAKQEAEKKFEEARELEKEGKKEEAEQIREDETALATPLPPVVKAEGTHLMKRWTWETEDENKIPREYMEPNKLKISETVRLLKGKANIPGVKVSQVSSVSTRIK